MKKKFKIIFMGTPSFAVPTLELLGKSNHDIVLVVTQPDRPRGRGRKTFPSPIKETAIRLGYDLIQPDAVRTEAFSDLVVKYEPDFFVVTAFGHILSEQTLSIPRIGAINIHASLLPRYRGSAPIQWAIINGEKETGVTTILMDKGMDTGDILLSSKTEITADETSATLHDRLSYLGAELLIKTLTLYQNDQLDPIPQDHTLASYAPMLKKNDGRIDWTMPPHKIEAFIRGMTPWPGAFTFHGEKRLKIFSALPVLIENDAPPGVVVEGFPDEMRVSTGKGLLSILEIQGESGKRLVIKDFLRGHKIPPGTILR